MQKQHPATAGTPSPEATKHFPKIGRMRRRIILKIPPKTQLAVPKLRQNQSTPRLPRKKERRKTTSLLLALYVHFYLPVCLQGVIQIHVGVGWSGDTEPQTPFPQSSSQITSLLGTSSVLFIGLETVVMTSILITTTMMTMMFLMNIMEIFLTNFMLYSWINPEILCDVLGTLFFNDYLQTNIRRFPVNILFAFYK